MTILSSFREQIIDKALDHAAVVGGASSAAPLAAVVGAVRELPPELLAGMCACFLMIARFVCEAEFRHIKACRAAKHAAMVAARRPHGFRIHTKVRRQ